MLNTTSRVDIVWDVRWDDSVKLARAERGSGIRTKVRPFTKIPTNWQGFLRVTENLKEIINLLAIQIQQYRRENKTTISTNGESVVSNDNAVTEHLSPCNHEEADTRMMLHVRDMAMNGMKKVRIRSIDTDVVVIATAHFNSIPGLEELWITFGRGNSIQYIPVHRIANHLGPDRCRGLLGFHSLTGCDSNSAFYGVGKKRAWSAWKDFPELTAALVHISSTSADVPANIMCLLEEFVVRMYSSSLTGVSSVNQARYELFHYGGKDFDHLPPTLDSLNLHVLRGAYTAGHIWGQALIKSPMLPSPSLWGYKMENTSWQPEWSTLPTITKKHLHICHCKKACKPPCVCAVNKVCCTSLCTCRGNCYGHNQS